MLFGCNIHGCETGLSLLERLMTQISLYQKNQDGRQGYDSCFVTKLLRNYRCHFHFPFGFVSMVTRLFQLVLKLINVQLFHLIFAGLILLFWKSLMNFSMTMSCKYLQIKWSERPSASGSTFRNRYFSLMLCSSSHEKFLQLLAIHKVMLWLTPVENVACYGDCVLSVQFGNIVLLTRASQWYSMGWWEKMREKQTAHPFSMWAK